VFDEPHGMAPYLPATKKMSRHKLFYQDPKVIRNQLNAAIELSIQIHQQEKALIQMLCEIDQRRFYVRYGYNSLMGFCQFGLKFSKMQAQSLVTKVRRSEPIVNFVDGDPL